MKNFLENGYFSLGEAQERTEVFNDGSVSTVLPWWQLVGTETVAYPLLSEIDPVLGESYPVPAKQIIKVGSDVANRFEWRYFIRRPPGTKSRMPGEFSF